MHIFGAAGKKENIDSLLKSDYKVWKIALANQNGRLKQGIRYVKGNDAIDFIPIYLLPTNKKQLTLT